MHALTSSHTTMLTSTRSSTLTSSVVPSAVCSVAHCSSLLSPHPTALPTPTCPNGNAVCAVLSILESAESSFASTACSCIGTGSISTVSVSITSTPQVSSTLKTTSPITSSVTPKTTARVASTISATSKVNSLTTRATSAAPTPSPPVLTPLCPAVSAGGEVASQYFAGSLVVENTNNYGNDNPYDFPPVYRSFPGTLDMCDAANECLEQAEDQLDGYLSFDLHFLGSNETWECVLYSDPNTDASAFNVSDPDALATFGFSVV